ncbi:hypothetical protein HETIRDRAFT_118770 [Heterobasidion irregulare TC 32-1]|uniref:Uncharacterized protein n=1 Tax=Heterobasidion irregulare (strain TC 32-1) TaxID=747525 RepID=W4JU95_HETIT|nr:uncharacterized protein HETIRDRAFT_118770 [Heterobasidion irregulare TC 32-1]ETW76446.1 hypothetical protein HETIRDRAFT_118770 [Heterobasidion irregulare TC 32-1]
MSTVWPPVERNSAGKMIQDSLGLMPDDILADYACQRYTTKFTIMAFWCYTRSSQFLCTKCSKEQKGCSFQPGWMLKDKGKSKGKKKSKVKVAKTLEEPEPSCPTKKHKGKLEVLEAHLGGWAVSDVVLVEDSLNAKDLDMSMLGDFVPNV